MISRRKLFGSAAVLALSVALPEPSLGAFLCFCNAGGTSGPTGYPGQAGNPVGYDATPSATPAAFTSANGQTWPGAYSSLTAWPGGTGSQTINSGTNATSGAGTSANPYVFAFYDFSSGTGGVQINLNNCIFVGCRFQSNAVANYNVQTGSTNVTFIYCSFVPLVSLYTSPPGAAWPSAGAGQNTTTQITNVNCIDGSSGFQVGLSLTSGASNITSDHCNCWGAGNSFSQMTGTISNLTYSDCWIHDPPNISPQSYHVDGIAYVNGSTPPSNVLVKHCTLASVSNTANGIGFQNATSAYTNITVTQCYLTGYEYCVDMCHNVSGNSSLTFTNNVLGTDCQWYYGPLYTDFTTQFQNGNAGGNVWTGNTLYVLAGTTKASTSNFNFTSANSGQYIWPDSTLHTTDF